MSRACANCEAEAGILDRADSTKSHGQCRRHFVQVLLAGGIPLSVAEAGAAEVKSWCPDLSLQEAA